jgi:hypothetical protein
MNRSEKAEKLKHWQAEGKRHEFYCPKGEKNKTFDANYANFH